MDLVTSYLIIIHLLRTSSNRSFFAFLRLRNVDIAIISMLSSELPLLKKSDPQDQMPYLDNINGSV